MKLKKLVSVLLCSLAACMAFTACRGGNSIEDGPAQSDFPVTIGNVTIRSQPEKVAVLSANLADVVMALNYEICLVAKSEDCTQEALSVLPNVTLDDAQGIKSTGATLVLLESEPSQAQRESIEKAGLTVLVEASATSREDLSRLYRETGSALRGAKTGYQKGERIASQIFMGIDDISRMIPPSDIPVSVCYLLDVQGGAVTGDSMQGKLIESSGLVNAVGDGTGNKVEIATLRIVNPQYIFCPTGMKEKLSSTEGYKDLSAVKEDRVFEMDPNWMTLQGESMTQAVIFMAGTVYPELMDKVDSSSAASSSSSAGSSPAEGTLQSGDENEAVMSLQKRLDELGYMFVAPTGFYGDATVTAVKGFQMYNGMSATGIADKATQDVLFSDSAKSNPNA